MRKTLVKAGKCAGELWPGQPKAFRPRRLRVAGHDELTWRRLEFRPGCLLLTTRAGLWRTNLHHHIASKPPGVLFSPVVVAIAVNVGC